MCGSAKSTTGVRFPLGTPSSKSALNSGMVAPTFLGIGAMKCGTTTVHEYLRSHPDVFVPRKKEINWFSSASKLSQRQYESIFPSHVMARGEISPQYGSRVSTIAKTYPDVRIILCVRNPIDRFISALRHFRTKYRKFTRKTDHPAYLYDVDQIIAGGHSNFILEAGFYKTIVTNVFSRFDARPYGQRLLVINFDRLVSNQQKVMNRLCGFLDVPTYSVVNPIHAHSSNRDSYDKVSITDEQRQALAAFYKPSNDFMRQHYHIRSW